MSERRDPPTVEELREMPSEEYLDWLAETGQDVDQFDEADVVDP